MTRSFSFFVLLFGFAASSAADDESWPAEIPDHAPPAPGEHPRLFFREADLPALRERAKTPEGKALIARLKHLLGGGEAMPKVKNDMTTAYGKEGGPKPREDEWPDGTYSMSHAAGFGFLYQLTGEQRYADLGRECFEWAFEGVRDRDREARYSWKKPGGALRSGPSLGWYAVGYDLCFDGWDEAFREEVAKAIFEYDEGKFMKLSDLVRGKRHMPSSNHWGMQVGGGALAVLAIHGDPGVDSDATRQLLDESEKAMIRNLTQGFGDRGWFREGDGTGVMASNISFAPALQAWRIAGGKDFITPRPNAPWMYLKWVHRTIPRDGEPDVLKLGAYPHNVYARTGISGPGTFSIGFGTVNEAEKPALLWLYEQTQRACDEANDTPFETTSGYPHHVIMAFLNWPFDAEPVNPAEVLPRAVKDETAQFYSFRDRWQDENDVLIQIQTLVTRGWHKAETKGEIHVWASGKQETWGQLPGKLIYEKIAEDGSAVLTDRFGRSLAIDFSRASGADVMLVQRGQAVPKGDASAELLGKRVEFRFFNYDASKTAPEVREDGQQLLVGEQRLSVVDEHHLALATMHD